jgi:hypothetical protein
MRLSQLFIGFYNLFDTFVKVEFDSAHVNPVVEHLYGSCNPYTFYKIEQTTNPHVNSFLKNPLKWDYSENVYCKLSFEINQSNF